MHAILEYAPRAEQANPPWTGYRVLVLDGHPRCDSFTASIAERFHDAAAGATGQSSHLIRIRDLDFDPDYVPGGVVEPCLQGVQELLEDSDCVVLVHPVWWGTAPTVMKGFLDRILIPGFAFEELPGGAFRGMLNGKSALILNTMDTSPWVFRWILRSPGTRMMRLAVLNFCGIKQVDSLVFGPVKTSTPGERAEWLERVGEEGAGLHKRFRDGWKAKLAAWLQALRPQFYVVPLFAVYVGALLVAAGLGTAIQVPMLVAAMVAAFLAEFIAVLTNELNDQNTDALNESSSPFNGGSRMLVEQRLTSSELRAGRVGAFSVLLFVVALFWVVDSEVALVLTGFMALGTWLAHAYTGPPLKLVYRSLGEPVVAFTNGLFVLALGMASQGGSFPWQTYFAVGVPLSLAILAAITLAGLPDVEADAAAGKKTWAVRFGRPVAVRISMVCAPLAAVLFFFFGPAALIWKGLALAHTVILTWRLVRYQRAGCPAGRIDGLLILALSMIVWFVLGPFFTVGPTSPR